MLCISMLCACGCFVCVCVCLCVCVHACVCVCFIMRVQESIVTQIFIINDKISAN